MGLAPNIASQTSVRPAPSRPARHRISPITQREGGGYYRSGGKVAQFESNGCILRRPARVGFEGELAPDHERNEFLVGCPCRFSDAGDTAVLQHRHAIGNLEYLAHAMRNVDDSNTLRSPAAE